MREWEAWQRQSSSSARSWRAGWRWGATKVAVKCDFENGVQGWQKWSPIAMTQTVRHDLVHSGRGALWGEVKERGTLVQSLWGLDFPIAGARLSFWYFVPKSASFDRFEMNVRTTELGDKLFQVARAMRKGVWTRMDLGFDEFFGASMRKTGAMRLKEFEVATSGLGGFGIDDFEVTIDEAEAARAARVPAMIYVAGQDATAMPGGAWAYFRKRFDLGDAPRHAWLQVAGDDVATVWVNGQRLGEAGLSPATEFDLRPLLKRGANVIAAAVVNHGNSPGPTGFAAVIGLGEKRLDETVTVSDKSWLASAEAKEGWEKPEFDDHAWTAAQEVSRVPGPPWGNWMIIDIYPLLAPKDRTVPKVRAEVNGGRVVAVLEPWATDAAAMEVAYTARLSRVADDMTKTLVAEKKGTAKVAGEAVRIDLEAAEKLEGALEVEVRFAGSDSVARKMLWLAGKAEAKVDRRSATRVEATGYIRTVQLGGKWFLADAEGNLFHSLACNAVIHTPPISLEYSHYVNDAWEDPKAWAEFACRRLFGLGFNSLAGGDDAIEPHRRRNMPFFAGMCLTWAGPKLRDAGGNTIIFPDVFDPEWVKGAESWVVQETDKYRDDPLLIGYFTDNEIVMHQPLSRGLGVMDCFWSAPCAAELSRWLSERYAGDIGAMNRKWTSKYHAYNYSRFEDIVDDKPTLRGEDDPVAGDLKDFVRHIIKTYADTIVGLYRKHDPHHLVCTNRFAGEFDTSFADLLKPFDIVACNSYPRSHWGQTSFDDGQLKWLRDMHRITGKPVLITEWGTMAADTGMCNTWGAARYPGPTWRDVWERGQATVGRRVHRGRALVLVGRPERCRERQLGDRRLGGSVLRAGREGDG